MKEFIKERKSLGKVIIKIGGKQAFGRQQLVY